MAKMTQQECIEFGRASADMAWDQRNSTDYRGAQDAIDSHRENVRDTLNEHQSAEWEPYAFRAFDERIVALRGDYSLVMRDSAGREVSLPIASAELLEAVRHGASLYQATDGIESNAYRNAIARGLIGDDAWFLPRS